MVLFDLVSAFGEMIYFQLVKKQIIKSVFYIKGSSQHAYVKH